jgi:hypothetical protein
MNLVAKYTDKVMLFSVVFYCWAAYVTSFCAILLGIYNPVLAYLCNHLNSLQMEFLFFLLSWFEDYVVDVCALFVKNLWQLFVATCVQGDHYIFRCKTYILSIAEKLVSSFLKWNFKCWLY